VNKQVAIRQSANLTTRQCSDAFFIFLVNISAFLPSIVYSEELLETKISRTSYLPMHFVLILHDLTLSFTYL